MSYHIRLDEEEAAISFANLPAPIRGYLSSELRRLASNPATLSTPAHFPHPLEGQLFHPPSIVIGGVEHFLTILFLYSRDETTLLVKWIVHQSGPEIAP